MFSFCTASVAALTLDDPAPLNEEYCKNFLDINCPSSATAGGKIIYGRLLLIINTVILGALTAAALAFIYGAFKYITSTGDEAEAKKAKRVIIYAILGLIIIGISGIAVNYFINVLAPPVP